MAYELHNEQQSESLTAIISNQFVSTFSYLENNNCLFDQSTASAD